MPLHRQGEGVLRQVHGLHHAVGGGGGHLQALPQPPDALVVVGIMMTSAFKEIQWEDFSEAVPAFFAGLFMALCYSISYGIAFGVISYVLIRVFSGRRKEVNGGTWVIAALFTVMFLVTH